jgi:hypothetical protein
LTPRSLNFTTKLLKTVRDVAMLVLLLRLLRDAVTFCILENTRESTTAEERFLVHIGWRDKGARISENWLRG